MTFEEYTQKTVLLNYGDHYEQTQRKTRIDIGDPDYAYVVHRDVIYLAEWDEDAELYVVDMNQE